MSPAVRANSVRTTLETAGRLRPGLSDRIVADLPGRSRRAILETPPLSWVSIEHDRHFARALHRHLGDAGMRELFGAVVPDHFDGPLLRSMVLASQRLFGVNPGSLVWATERMWGLVFRGYCQPVVIEQGERSAQLDLLDVATEILEEPAYPVGFESIFNGYLVALDATGEVDLSIDPETRKIRVRFAW